MNANFFAHRNPRFWLLLAAIVCAFAAALRPTLTLPTDLYRYLFVFDITQSMNVADVSAGGRTISRLEMAKRATQQLLENMPCGSEAGIGIFTQHRTLLLFSPVEVCTHFSEITSIISDIDWRMAWRARSEVAKGLHTALLIGAAREPPVRLIFVTDGHEAPPVNPDLPPRFSGTPGAVEGLIVGVGGDVPVAIPKLDPSGKLVGHWSRDEVMQVDVYSLGRTGTVAGESMVGVDNSDVAERIAAGKEHLSWLHEAYLRQLAAELKIGYLRLRDESGFVEALLDRRLAFQRPAPRDIHRWLGTGASLALLLVFLPGRPGTATRRDTGWSTQTRQRSSRSGRPGANTPSARARK